VDLAYGDMAQRNICKTVFFVGSSLRRPSSQQCVQRIVYLMHVRPTATWITASREYQRSLQSFKFRAYNDSLSQLKQWNLQSRKCQAYTTAFFSTKQANLLQDSTYVNSSTVGHRKSNQICGYSINQPTVTWLSAILPAYMAKA
jgi:hypothetical protein